MWNDPSATMSEDIHSPSTMYRQGQVGIYLLRQIMDLNPVKEVTNNMTDVSDVSGRTFQMNVNEYFPSSSSAYSEHVHRSYTNAND